MEREILLGITGTQWEMLDDGGQGPKDAEAVEMLTSADYFFENGKHYFVYEEASESGRKSGKSKRTLSCYETPYGQLHFGVWTTGIDLDVKEDEIFAEIRYRMEMEDHPMADCCVKIHACTKGEKSAQMVKAMMERQKKELSEE